MTAPSFRKQENNFGSQAVAARDLRNVPSDTYSKAINETVESVGNFILVDTKRWGLALESSDSPKLPCAILEYIVVILRGLTYE